MKLGRRVIISLAAVLPIMGALLFTAGPAAAYGPNGPTLACHAFVVHQGQVVPCHGTNWKPGDTVELAIVGISLRGFVQVPAGSTTVAADGSISFTVTIPRLRAGFYTLYAHDPANGDSAFDGIFISVGPVGPVFGHGDDGDPGHGHGHDHDVAMGPAEGNGNGHGHGSDHGRLGPTRLVGSTSPGTSSSHPFTHDTMLTAGLVAIVMLAGLSILMTNKRILARRRR